jgi:hypothetical protein
MDGPNSVPREHTQANPDDQLHDRPFFARNPRQPDDQRNRDDHLNQYASVGSWRPQASNTKSEHRNLIANHGINA